MKSRIFAPLRGGVLMAASAAVLFTSAAFIPSVLAQAQPRWEAVKGVVATGKAVRIEVRLIGSDGKPSATSATVKSVRLDMGPDGMPTMAAKLKPVAAAKPGTLAFEADLPMAGRWALTISADVAGLPAPVSGVIVFTASERSSDATPAAPAAGDRKILYYRNPMGLADVSPVPKKDSMGMDYIPVHADETGGPAGSIRISPEKIQRAGVRTEVVARRPLTKSIRAFGTVTADESRIGVFTAKFDGFVEELFVPATGAEVQAGQKLARVWIDSRDILQKQSDLLVAMRSGRTAEIERSEANLRLFGIPEQVIAGLRRTGDPQRSIVLTATRAGTVMEKRALTGQRFAAGDPLFRVVDLSAVWIIAQVAERDLSGLQVGQKASVALKASPGEGFEGRVAFIYPELQMDTRTVPVRIEVANPQRRIRVGQYADIVIQSSVGNDPIVVVPESAILDSGTRQVAFAAKEDGLFEPRDVKLGTRADGWVEVKAGLSEGERIVVRGNFLIDAESNLRAALAAFTAAPPAE